MSFFLFLTCRLCQGLEWMMSRLRVRWWLWKRSLGVCPFSLIFASRYENEDGGKVSWWMALSSSLWNWHGQTAARTLCTSVIIYFTKVIWTENKKKTLPFQKDVEQQRDSNYLKWNFCTVFLWTKHRGQQRICLRTLHGLILELRVSLAHGGLAVLPNWLWWFLIASLCEQSSILFKLGACSRMFKRLWLMTTETCRGEGRITVCPLPFSPC